MIIPYAKHEEGVNPVNDAIRTLKKLRNGITLGKKLSVRKMMKKGRK